MWVRAGQTGVGVRRPRFVPETAKMRGKTKIGGYALSTSPTALRRRPPTTRIVRIPNSQRPAMSLRHQLHPTPNSRLGYKGKPVRRLHRSWLA